MSDKKYKTVPSGFVKFMAGKSGYFLGTLINATDHMRDKSDRTVINLPDSIEVICDNAFRGLDNVTKIKIDRCVECIGEYGLSNESVKEVEFTNFYNQAELTLKDNALADMPNLQQLVLPKNVSVGKNVFGPSLESLKIEGRPGKYDPDAFVSATSLTRIVVDESWLREFKKIIAACGANIEVLTEKELKAIRREKKLKAKAEARANAAAEAEKSKVYVTVRLHIQPDCGAEVRWAHRGNSCAPTFCSESYLKVVVETIFPKGKTDSRPMKIKKHVRWDDIDHRAYTYKLENGLNGSHGNWTNWKLSKKAPKLATELFNELTKGDGLGSRYTLSHLMGSNDFSILEKDDPWCEELILEYELKVNPAEYNPEKLVFFSFREKNDTDINILDGLSRYAKKAKKIETERAEFEAEQYKLEIERRELLEARKDELMKTRKGRREYDTLALLAGVHEAFEADEITSDDVILWFDYIGYGNSFAFIKSAVFKGLLEKKYDAPFPKDPNWRVVSES